MLGAESCLQTLLHHAECGKSNYPGASQVPIFRHHEGQLFEVTVPGRIEIRLSKHCSPGYPVRPGGRSLRIWVQVCQRKPLKSCQAIRAVKAQLVLIAAFHIESPRGVLAHGWVHRSFLGGLSLADNLGSHDPVCIVHIDSPGMWVDWIVHSLSCWSCSSDPKLCCENLGADQKLESVDELRHPSNEGRTEHHLLP